MRGRAGIMAEGMIQLDDFSDEEIIQLLDDAAALQDVARGERVTRPLEGRILANVFFEPSTRTRMSFEAAMKRLGGSVINMAELSSTSIAKGETLHDTIRVLDGYADIIVLRHPREGAARFADDLSIRPIINAGDGAGRHPTQTLLDLSTIRSSHGTLDVQIALVGDLRYGRTAHSLAKAMSRFGASIMLCNPKGLSMPDEVLQDLRKDGTTVKTYDTLDHVIANADVLYMTRIQRERFPDEDEYSRVAGSFRLTQADLDSAREGMIVLHPLPRVDEIDANVDGTEHAQYFEQAFHGVSTRMAILCHLLNVKGVNK